MASSCTECGMGRHLPEVGGASLTCHRYSPGSPSTQEHTPAPTSPDTPAALPQDQPLQVTLIPGAMGAKRFSKLLSHMRRLPHKYHLLGNNELKAEADEQCELKSVEHEDDVIPLPAKEASRLSKEELTKYLHVDLNSGLSECAVLQRRVKHGWNEFQVDSADPVWKKYLGQVKRDYVALIIQQASH